MTGATDDIGKGTARALDRLGAGVLLYGRDSASLEAARQETAAAPGN